MDDAEPFVIESRLNNDNEGFELSTLNVFNGTLYSCDDETGIIYELSQVPAEENANQAQNPQAGNRRPVNRQNPQKAERNTTYVAQPWIILSNEGENTGKHSAINFIAQKSGV